MTDNPDVIKGLELAREVRASDIFALEEAYEALRAHLQGMADKAAGAAVLPESECRQAMDEELSAMLCVVEQFENPRQALQAIINWRVSVALDPAVSEQAQDLIDRGRVEAAGAGVPEGWQDTIQGAIDELPYQHYLIPRLTQLLAAAPAAPQPALPLLVVDDVWRALTLAMAICDATPTRAHEAEEDGPLKRIGSLVNANNGAHGYAFIRDTLAQVEAYLKTQPATTEESSAPEPAQPTELERQAYEVVGMLNHCMTLAHWEGDTAAQKGRDWIAAFDAAYPNARSQS